MAKGYKVIIKTNYTYNSRNLLTQVTQVEQYTPELVETVTAQYTYDVRGLMTSSNAGGYVTSYTYDSHGNLSSCTYPGETTAETYIYNADGKISSCTDRKGVTKSYTYNAPGALKSISTGTQTITNYYSKNGLLSSESSGGMSIAYTYDSYGRKISDGTASYAYDANSNLVSVTIGSDVTTYSYDRAGRMLSAVNGLSVTNYTYDSRGLRTSTKNYYDGNLITQTDYAYNLAGLATSLVNKNAEGDVLSSFSYTYQFDGNVASETDHNGIVTNYTYDLLGRLIGETSAGSSKYYTYDAAGNRTKVIVDGVSQVLYTYNDKGQLVTETKTNGETSEVISYTYDANGNLISKAEGIKTTNYIYDTFGRMTSAGDTAYTYRPDGLRASKAISSGGTHYFAYVNGRLVRDCSDKYLYGLELIKSDNVFYLYNIHGDVIQLVTIGGSLYKTYDYDAYGNELTRDLNDTNPFRYCGEYYDVETGFIYLRARYYDPMVGRFTTVDPAKDGLNWYAYCNNNPVAFVDPLGLSAESAIGSSRYRSLTIDVGEQVRIDKYLVNNNAPGTMFDTMDEAAIGFAHYINAKSIAKNKEYASFIYEVDVPTTQSVLVFNPNLLGENSLYQLWNYIFRGNSIKTITIKTSTKKYSYVKPWGFSKNTSFTPINWFRQKNKVSEIHTHAAYDIQYDSDIFSLADKDTDFINYLVTPLGIIRKYNPIDESDIIIYENAPYDRNHPLKK